MNELESSEFFAIIARIRAAGFGFVFNANAPDAKPDDWAGPWHFAILEHGEATYHGFGYTPFEAITRALVQVPGIAV